MKRLLAAIVVCCVGTVAHADRGDRADRADQLFKNGKKLLAQKKYAEACTAFEDSDRLDPGIGAKLNVAKCYQEWGKLATAWRWYRDAERMATDARDDRARKIHALIEELEPSVPRLTVKAPADADPRGVVVKLDGVVLEASALGVERRVDPGPHQLDTVIDGETQTQVVPVERGASAEVTLERPTGPGAPGAPGVRHTSGSVAASAVDDPARTRRLVGVGVTAGGALAMGIAGIATLRASSDYDHALSGYCQGATNMCDDTGLTRTHAARDHANMATVVAIGGLAAVGAGLYLYFTAPGAPRSAEHAFYVAPRLDGDGGGVVLGGAF
jgi:tetratricopeptide (TPR) repeat protein